MKLYNIKVRSYFIFIIEYPALSFPINAATYNHIFIINACKLKAGVFVKFYIFFNKYKFKNITIPATFGDNAVIPYKTEIYNDIILVWGKEYGNIIRFTYQYSSKNILELVGKEEAVYITPQKDIIYLRWNKNY